MVMTMMNPWRVFSFLWPPKSLAERKHTSSRWRNALEGQYHNRTTIVRHQYFPARAQDSSFYMWELPMFALVATLGGLLGAGFVACRKRMDLFRARHLAGAKRRFIEVSDAERQFGTKTLGRRAYTE